MSNHKKTNLSIYKIHTKGIKKIKKQIAEKNIYNVIFFLLFSALSHISVLATIIFCLILALASVYYKMRKRMGGRITREEERNEEVLITHHNKQSNDYSIAKYISLKIKFFQI